MKHTPPLIGFIFGFLLFGALFIFIYNLGYDKGYDAVHVYAEPKFITIYDGESTTTIPLDYTREDWNNYYWNDGYKEGYMAGYHNLKDNRAHADPLEWFEIFNFKTPSPYPAWSK